MPRWTTKHIRKQTKAICAHEHNIFHEFIGRHIYHIHKYGHKLLHLAQKYNHHAIHLGELIVVWFLCVSHFVSSWFTANTGTTIITDHAIVASNLVAAMNQWQMRTNDSKIISMRMMDGDVDNSFYPWYCTYGAARISPEFFPFIEPKKQQRTWWGNAKDRCANAQATGYNIWSTPVAWALIVYSKIGNSVLFGHVGKVIYHNASKGTLIVRDMNRVGKFTMTDRRDEVVNPSIECYIYNKKTAPILVINTTQTWQAWWPSTWWLSTWWLSTGVLIATNTNDPQIIASIIPPTNTWTTTTTTPIIAITPPTISVEQFATKPIYLDFDSVSDLAKHFITQRNIEAKLTTKNTLKVWDIAMLTLAIKDPNTQAGFEWLLNLPFELIVSNDNIQTSYSLIQLIKEGRIDIAITAKNKWDTALIINFDGERIGKVNFKIE